MEEDKSIFLSDWISSFEPMSPAIQWLAFIISITALVVAVMALPTVFQMIWGKPKIRTSFKTSHRDKQKILQCYIENEEIEAYFLQKIGVTRRTAQIVCSFSIYEENTNKIVVKHSQTNVNSRIDEIFQPAALHSSWPIVCVPIFCGIEDGISKIFSGKDEEIIGSGYYRLDFHVTYGDGVICEASNKFHVGSSAEDLFWIN